MRRTRTTGLLLAGGLVLGAPALSACSDEPAVEELEDGGAIVDDTNDVDVGDPTDTGDGVEEQPDGQ